MFCRAVVLVLFYIFFFFTDPNKTFLNVTEKTYYKEYTAETGDKVQWIIDITGHPQPTIRW